MKNLLIAKVAREHHSELVREADRRRLAKKLGRARKLPRVSPLNGDARPPGRRDIEIRWGLAEDEPRIVELLALNGMPRRTAIEEQFIVAEEDGEVLAAMTYQTAPKRLLLGIVIADPWAGERDLAVALYTGVRDLAHELGVRKILARSYGCADYARAAGYRRGAGGRRLDTSPPSRSWGR